MPFAVCKQLGLEAPISMSMRLLIPDRIIKNLLGIIYNFLVRVENLVFVMDFVILDCEVDFDIPIILGRPFLSTWQGLVDMDLG